MHHLLTRDIDFQAFPSSPLCAHPYTTTITTHQSQILVHLTEHNIFLKLCFYPKNACDFKYSTIMCLNLFGYKWILPPPNLPGRCNMLIMWLWRHWQLCHISPAWLERRFKNFKMYQPPVNQNWCEKNKPQSSILLLPGHPLSFWRVNAKILGSNSLMAHW